MLSIASWLQRYFTRQEVSLEEVRLFLVVMSIKSS